MTDDEAMAIAIREATLALDHDDVPVGAVVLIGGNVIAQRHNERELRKDPTAHAEILALQDAAENARQLAPLRCHARGDARALPDVCRCRRARTHRSSRVRRFRPEDGRVRFAVESVCGSPPQS